MRLVQKVSHIMFPHKICSQVSGTKYQVPSPSRWSEASLPMSLHVKFGQDTTNYYWDIADFYQPFLIPNFLFTSLRRLASYRGDFTPKNNP